MFRDPEALIHDLEAATEPGFRGRLLARGQAQSMIRRDGRLPEGSPEFSIFLDADLLNYGYALLDCALDLLDAIEADDDNDRIRRTNVARQACIQASYALEAATRNTADSPNKEFHLLLAGAASHLGSFAARAFSLMDDTRQSQKLTPMELTLADLAMRNLEAIEERTRLIRSSTQVSDESLLAALSGDDERAPRNGADDPLGPVALLLSENYLAAVSAGLFGIEVGEPDLLGSALEDLALGQQASLDVSAPGPWWVFRLTRRLLADLSDTSMDNRIPDEPPFAGDVDGQRWRYLRSTFIESLFARGRSEIDLWPSQLHVVDRIFADTRDLVVALPTSAGKTRIAELAILACLAQGSRTVYVTPLRTLSAQTERVLTRTFGPLGVRVSSLYGSMGFSGIDDDAMRASEIVVATPEKLDFAIRSDPSILDDVGLIVLDEGHMIGASEREVRYEAQIQRLLRRPDASVRRILCLSAVFPSGTELDDFVAWITNDDPDGLHRETWRPTLQRFGLVEWLGSHARLAINLGSDQPFIPSYFEARQPSGRRRKLFPDNHREFVIATAWRLVEEGQTVLVFCPQRNSVEPYAREIIKLHAQGLITPILPENVDLSGALTVGAEWFGSEHPILQCLQLGIAIHHGALPGPFRREVDKLLDEGKLKVTIASPTLAQGLNLSASTVLFHSLKRGRELLKSADFLNVIGRAGRAFVDTEGLVLCPIFEPITHKRERHRQDWLQLTNLDAGKSLDSGLIEVGVSLLRRMYMSQGPGSIEAFLNYLTGGLDWTLPVVELESAEAQSKAAATWKSNLTLLDIGILSVIGDVAHDSDPEIATQAIADALVDSLWERQLGRVEIGTATALRELVTVRVRHLWETSTPAQRRGWYLAGLGAEDGKRLASISGEVIELIYEVELDLANDDHAAASDRFIAIATSLFALPTFAPKHEVEDWTSVLRHWVMGMSLAGLSKDRVAIAEFIESDVIYRLVWGMEAVQLFEVAQANPLAESVNGSAITVVETGTMNRSASTLVRSGFDHRLAAIRAVDSTGADFDSAEAMRQWIDDLDPRHAHDHEWPSPESRASWEMFIVQNRFPRDGRWRRQTYDIDDVIWFGDVPAPNTWLRITYLNADTVRIWSSGFDSVGEAAFRLNPDYRGILRGRRLPASTGIQLIFRGAGDLRPQGRETRPPRI